MDVILHPERSRVQREVSNGVFQLRLKNRVFQYKEYKGFYAAHEGRVTRLDDDTSSLLVNSDIYALHPDATSGDIDLDAMGRLRLTVDGTDVISEFVLHALIVAGAVEIRP